VIAYLFGTLKCAAPVLTSGFRILNFDSSCVTAQLEVSRFSKLTRDALYKNQTYINTMDLPPEELLIHTLSLLEWRLKRLEFVLNGSSIQQESESANVLTRLHKLEQSLNQLAGKSDTVSELLKLRRLALLEQAIFCI
jgi:hypothetical protein